MNHALSDHFAAGLAAAIPIPAAAFAAASAFSPAAFYSPPLHSLADPAQAGSGHSLLVQNLTRFAGDPHTAALAADGLDLRSNAGCFPVRGHDHHIGDMDRGLALRDAALDG